MADFALELSFDDTSDAAIREQWDVLKSAGLPSQADHKSMTNAPHLTLIAASAISPDIRAAARAELSALLPCPLPVAGLVVFGVGARRTVAHLIEPDPQLLAVTAMLRHRTGAVRHPSWTPHVTLARRVPRADVGRAIAILNELPSPSLVATRLRYWDPAAGTISELVGQQLESS